MKTALFTVSYNRPDLMQELLQGLAKNADDLDGIDVFHYVDGGPKSKQDEIKSTLNNPTCLVHRSSYARKLWCWAKSHRCKA